MKLQFQEVTLVCIGSDHLDEAKFAVELCESFCDFGKHLWLTDVIDNNNQPHIQYNDFIVNKLAALLETPYCLLIQWDGFILNPGAWQKEWFGYDYIGAPWGLDDPEGVGNGGFSFRSRGIMQSVARLGLPPEKCMPEDTTICKVYREHLMTRGWRFAPPAVGERFSVETNSFHPQIKYDGQFGFHNIYTAGIMEKIKPMGFPLKA